LVCILAAACEEGHDIYSGLKDHLGESSCCEAVLEEAMTKVPAEQATTATKAYLAEFILKSAAGGLTNYEGLISAAVSQLPTILSMFT
jgi:hypothetical protein